MIARISCPYFFNRPSPEAVDFGQGGHTARAGADNVGQLLVGAYEMSWHALFPAFAGAPLPQGVERSISTSVNVLRQLSSRSLVGITATGAATPRLAWYSPPAADGASMVDKGMVVYGLLSLSAMNVRTSASSKPPDNVSNFKVKMPRFTMHTP